jgi:alpha-glucosidase
MDGDMARAARLNMLLLLALRGNPIIYQGEELGLPQGEVAFEDLRDPEAIANWPHTLGRDGARTPMPWQESAPQAGFSSAARTWLRCDPVHAAFAVDRQSADPRSTLNYTRALLGLRRQHPALASGASTLLDTPEALVAFLRHDASGTVLCAFNLGEEVLEWAPPAAFAQGRLFASEKAVGTGGHPPMVLAPGSGYWAVNHAEQA